MIISSATESSCVAHFLLFHLLLNTQNVFLQLSLPCPTPTLKTLRITMLRCLQILCCRTLELPTNNLVFLYCLTDTTGEQSYHFLLLRQPQTGSYITGIFLYSTYRHVLTSRSVSCSVMQMKLLDWMLLAIVLHLHSTCKVAFS